MAASQAQIDLDRRIAGTAKDAVRVGDAMRLFPMVLLRHDARVQRAYEAWRRRAEHYEDAGQFTEAAAVRSLFEDAVQLNALVRELKLQRYQSWLPTMLRWEFQRALEGASQVEVALPNGLPWKASGRGPKQGATHREDLERSLTWFYRRQVKQPSDSKYALQQEYIEARRREGVTITAAKRQINHALTRAEQLLACIDAPYPQ
jgi:hypothetical protein